MNFGNRAKHVTFASGDGGRDELGFPPGGCSVGKQLVWNPILRPVILGTGALVFMPSDML